MFGLIALTGATFCAVFLKIFQQKNVIGGHRISMAMTSYGIAMFEVTTITLIVHNGWMSVFASGTGGALAALFAVKMHDKLFKRTQ